MRTESRLASQKLRNGHSFTSQLRDYFIPCSILRHMTRYIWCAMKVQVTSKLYRSRKSCELKDRAVLDGWWGLYPLERHDRVTIPVDLTGPNILLIKVVSVGGTFRLLVPCMRKLHTRPALTWDTGLKPHWYSFMCNVALGLLMRTTDGRNSCPGSAFDGACEKSVCLMSEGSRLSYLLWVHEGPGEQTIGPSRRP